MMYFMYHVANSLSSDPSALFPVPSPVGGPPRMIRSNSIPTHDASLELDGASPLGSTISLAERPRSMGMVRSDKDEGKPSELFQYLLCDVFPSVSNWFILLLFIFSFQFTGLFYLWRLTPRPVTPR